MEVKDANEAAEVAEAPAAAPKKVTKKAKAKANELVGSKKAPKKAAPKKAAKKAAVKDTAHKGKKPKIGDTISFKSRNGGLTIKGEVVRMLTGKKDQKLYYGVKYKNKMYYKQLANILTVE